MSKLYMITVHGLDVRSDWAIVHDRLLDDFPRIDNVLATTMAATLLIVYEGRAEIDAWLDAVSEEILSHRRKEIGNGSVVATTPNSKRINHYERTAQ